MYYYLSRVYFYLDGGYSGKESTQFYDVADIIKRLWILQFIQRPKRKNILPMWTHTDCSDGHIFSFYTILC